MCSCFIEFIKRVRGKIILHDLISLPNAMSCDKIFFLSKQRQKSRLVI